jgi:hypothetical protein
MSGGISSLMADVYEQVGLELPIRLAVTQHKLDEIIPAYGSAHNPIDLTTAVYARPGMAGEVIELLRDSGAVDDVLVQLNTNADPSRGQRRGESREPLTGPIAASTDRPSRCSIARTAPWRRMRGRACTCSPGPNTWSTPPRRVSSLVKSSDGPRTLQSN